MPKVNKADLLVKIDRLIIDVDAKAAKQQADWKITFSAWQKAIIKGAPAFIKSLRAEDALTHRTYGLQWPDELRYPVVPNRITSDSLRGIRRMIVDFIPDEKGHLSFNTNMDIYRHIQWLYGEIQKLDEEVEQDD